jgi:hypothetical protein
VNIFSWVPVRPSRRFASPCFTELTPARQMAAGTSTGEAPLVAAAAPFDTAVLSWNGVGRWRLEMRLQLDSSSNGGGSSTGDLTPYFVMGVLEGTRQRSAVEAERPFLLDTPLTASTPSTPVRLEVDTLALSNGATATGFQVRAAGEGDLRTLAVAHYRRDGRQSRYTHRPAIGGAWGTILPVPERAQRDVEEERARLGGQVCSPTCLAMVLAYHGSVYRTIEVARAAFDAGAQLYGNWPCNTGAAARLLNGGRGGWSAVVKMDGFDPVEREIAAGRPVILSHRWEPGDLENAPVSRSNGHLIVVVGFTKDGDVVVNDPAAKVAGAVRRVYKRRELFRTWQIRGEGIAYLVHPR